MRAEDTMAPASAEMWWKCQGFGCTFEVALPAQFCHAHGGRPVMARMTSVWGDATYSYSSGDADNGDPFSDLPPAA